MPSGHKKKNSKLAFAASSSQQRKMKMGKENHPPEKKTEGDQNREKGKKMKHFLAENEGEGNLRSCKSFFYNGLAEQMNAFESKASRVSSISSKIAQSEAASSGEESHIVIEALETREAVLDKAKVTPIPEAKESAHGKEIKLMANEGEPMEGAQNDEVEAISLKTMAPPILEESAHGKEGKLMIDEEESMDASQNGEVDVISPQNEIHYPPMVERRATVWNCCGLFEAFKCFQP